MNTPLLETERLYLRPFESGDVQAATGIVRNLTFYKNDTHSLTNLKKYFIDFTYTTVLF